MDMIKAMNGGRLLRSSPFSFTLKENFVFRKKMLGALAALAIILTGGLVALTPSSASAALSDCPNGTFCTWTANNYTGTMRVYSYSNYGPTGSCHAVQSPGTTLNSWSNDFGSGLRVRLYYANACISGYIQVDNQINNPNVTLSHPYDQPLYIQLA